ncbi:hypothetical protein KR100_03185 [Synechococcus sp. KORDI-100]|nr:hypothetical protein KR100_03185 [Synechococcus sp. KORDI-100]
MVSTGLRRNGWESDRTEARSWQLNPGNEKPLGDV